MCAPHRRRSSLDRIVRRIPEVRAGSVQQEEVGDPHPFHPTGVGSLRTASSVVRLVGPAEQR